MSDYEELMFEAEFELAVEQLDQDMAVHAHTGDGCAFCEAMTSGRAAKENGTTQVKRDQAWWATADEWLRAAWPGYHFTADDLVEMIGKPSGSVNQIGARLRSWAMAERIDPVGFTEAGRKESHGRVLRVWAVK